MFKFLDGMKIRKKLTVGYLIVIAFMILSGIINAVSLSILYGNMNTYINGAQKADTAVKMCRINTNIAARNIREMALNDNRSTYLTYKQKVEETMKLVEENILDIQSTGLMPEELYQEYVEGFTKWSEVGNRIISDLAAGNKEQATEAILTECVPALDELVALAKEMDAVTEDLKAQVIQTNLIVFITALVSGIVFIALAVLSAVLIAGKIVNSIMTPVQELEAAVKALSEGALHSEVKYHSEDELGSLADSYRTSLHVLNVYVEEIERAMGEFSKGNFTVQPEIEWEGDFVEIANALLSFENTMVDTVKGIHQVADQVKNGSEQVSQSSMDLAQGATEQAGITQELAATIDNISEQVSQNAERAEEISAEVNNVGLELANSNSKMHEMVDSMKEINNSSSEIGKIIATINDIASQTNLLALNASIEAARAGEAGKGFAVVADQVSLLAAQSSQAAKESTALIESSVRAVEKGMLIANETAKQLEEVVEGSKVITEDVSKVSQALNDQQEAFEQINIGVAHINDVVQTNSATSEECAAASQEMSGQAESLEKLISKFKV